MYEILTIKDESDWSEWLYKWGKSTKDYTDWHFRMWPLAALTGQENVWTFCWDKKVAVITK